MQKFSWNKLNIYFKYIFSILATILGTLLTTLVNKGFVTLVHKHLIRGVVNVVYLLLKISGFNAQISGHLDTFPIIGTDIFRVKVYDGCSGFEGISTFLVAFTFMILVLLKWKRVKTINALVVACIGSLVMYSVNIVRIYVLILIGHFYGSKFAVDLWHSQGSAFLYAITIIAILAVSNRWMLSAVSGKPASDWSLHHYRRHDPVARRKRTASKMKDPPGGVFILCLYAEQMVCSLQGCRRVAEKGKKGWSTKFLENQSLLYKTINKGGTFPGELVPPLLEKNNLLKLFQQTVYTHSNQID